MENTMQRAGAFIKRFLIVLFGGSVGIALIGGGSLTILSGAVKSMGFFPEYAIRIGIYELAHAWIMPVTGVIGALLVFGGLCSLWKAFNQF